MHPARLASLPAGLAFSRAVEAAGDGDPRALAALARGVQPLLEVHARRALGRHRGAGLDLDDAARDVVAEVQAFLAGGCGDGPGWRRYDARRACGGVAGWLYGIVRNKARLRVREARRREDFRGALDGGGAEPPSMDRALDAARALRLARELPARERAALALWLDDAPSREIASRLRFASPHAVDCCLARGKQRLRAMMDVAA